MLMWREHGPGGPLEQQFRIGPTIDNRILSCFATATNTYLRRLVSSLANQRQFAIKVHIGVVRDGWDWDI